MKKEVYEKARTDALRLYEAAHILLTEAEKGRLEVADFGLNDLARTGLEIVTYVNTERCCAKEMVLFGGQTCPEHRHVPLAAIGYAGKEETFRCRWGLVYLYVAGAPTTGIKATVPAGDEAWYTVFHEIVLRPGEQYTMMPDTAHWFQAGPEGAVVSEFSTKSLDEYDLFTDPRIKRIPEIEG